MGTSLSRPLAIVAVDGQGIQAVFCPTTLSDRQKHGIFLLWMTAFLSDPPIGTIVTHSREGIMKRKDLKNLLAGMGIASLVGAGGLAVSSGPAAASSG